MEFIHIVKLTCGGGIKADNFAFGFKLIGPLTPKFLRLLTCALEWIRCMTCSEELIPGGVNLTRLRVEGGCSCWKSSFNSICTSRIEWYSPD